VRDISHPPFNNNSAVLVAVRTAVNSSLELGRRYTIDKEGSRIGNTTDCDIFLPDLPPRCHLYLFQKNQDWYVHDVSGSSRASLRGIRFQMNRIEDGSLLQIGPFTFEFCLADGVKAGFFERIYESLTEDILTKTYNRRYFYNLLDWEIKKINQHDENRRTQKLLTPLPNISLIMLDIDHFGEINKKHGHQVGDEILKGVVQRIKTRVRSTDVMARYGGEEFCIYLPDTDKKQALDLAEQICKRVADEPFFVSGKPEPLFVTISLGIALYQPETTLNAFIKIADDWMRRAKTEGRNRVKSEQ